jgi:hypothetical protein
VGRNLFEWRCAARSKHEARGAASGCRPRVRRLGASLSVPKKCSTSS